MLEMSIAEEVTISERQFAQFVMDEWDWKEKATMTNMGYSVGAGR
jgi:hypothetical protein